MQALLAAIVDSSDDAIVSKSLDGIILSWNAAAERIFGYPAAEAVGRSIHLIIPPERRGEEEEILRKLRRGQRIEHLETVRVRKDGRRVHVSLTVSPVRDASGRIVGASKVARDVTEQRRAHRALEDSEQRLRLALDAGRMGTWEWYLPTNTVTWSPGLEAIHGLAPGTFPGTFDAYQGDIHPDDRASVQRSIQETLAGGEHHLEYRIVWPDGSEHWVEGRGKLFHDEDEKPLRMIGVCTEITERKRYERELQEADRRKDEFLATLAHELRNPLAPIRNALEIMKRAEDQPALVLRARDTMERQVSLMERLIDDLLDLSRISRNKLALRRQRVELASAVHHAVEASRPLAERMGHEVVVQLPAEPVHVSGDPARLVQVFSNLLNNACKYTPPGGRVRLEAQRQGQEVVVAVEDNGVGIPAEVLPQIFEMFVQADRSLERQGGLGIGLTLVRQLVELHGGRVEARSEGPGKGSTFRVALPVEAGIPEVVAAPGPALPIASSPRRILVVDDNQDGAESLCLLLKLAGHETALAFDGVDALETAERFRPDLVLLDLGLPGLNGYEVCRRLRAQPWGKGMTVVALTGWGQEADRRRSEDAGFDGHLVKPMDLKALAALLASLPSTREVR
ncbi:MAG TPA: PAS domain S-box protein [Candidatus Polarisedimenticolaceae bacterium]|nr:PAS domain S-box protein [Candidatus Polarisedimenticolaceae bacterium]